MTKTAAKHNKKEEQKKLIVRIVCMVLAVALIITSLITVMGTGTTEYTLEEMIQAGIVYQGEDGNYYFTEEYLASEESHDHD